MKTTKAFIAILISLSLMSATPALAKGGRGGGKATKSTTSYNTDGSSSGVRTGGKRGNQPCSGKGAVLNRVPQTANLCAMTAQSADPKKSVNNI